MNVLLQTELLSEYLNQSNSEFSSHVDGHMDWQTGTEDDVNHTDKHEDCDLL